MIIKNEPYYQTKLGAAYLGNSLELMANIPDGSIDLICTSPPFALVRKKEYGNVDADQYVEWFKDFAIHFHRILKPTGSLVIDIGGSWIKGKPVRSLYHFELVIALCKAQKKGGLGFYLAQELYWYNPAKLPTPAEWVTVRRERVKDAVNTIWWLSKDPHPKANNRRVLKPYSQAMKNLLKNGYKPKLRPSGHDISHKFGNDRGGAIPPNIIDGRNHQEKEEMGQPTMITAISDDDLIQSVNLISASNTASNDYYQKRCKEEGFKPYPARFPQALPEFIINLCTGINKDCIDELYTLTPGQKHFLLSLLNLHVKVFTPANKIAEHTRSIYKLRLTSKNLVKDIIQPLVNLGLIETEKTTGGRGAKSNNVKLTTKAEFEVLAPLLKSIANETRLSEIELNRTFEDVVNDLNHPDKHIKGKALELLAIWMIRLTSLRFTKWRSREKGKGEVDVLAASDRFVYSRWQIQCKNTNKVDIDVLAKEIGLTFVTGADVVMVVTTGEFTREAYQYAYRMMEVSRYYMILLQKDDIERIKQDKTNIVEILDKKARRVFSKKELDVSDEELNEIETEENFNHVNTELG